ncbi:MAG TPA: ribulose-phosphate 3-epimerase [Bacteroidales bacterium]|nr:ribulose-phosphate 3-epimerase [Bacteroidales bacterium]HNR42261.1 ribulose-phosphate 3-epimerase [Bacteroidales bacterium]HQG76816.1 ribulose-phosphate 3-epimerase [Bacteroidales bacterium]
MKHLVSPSLLASDFLNLGREVKMINSSVADWIHLDIMDGVFVPNISFGFPVLEHVREVAQKPLDVHLMITDPDRYITRFCESGAGILTVQYEACTHLQRTVTEIRNHGAKAGVAVNPHTPVILLKNILPYVDMVLIMTVNPGFGGQAFISESYGKIRELRAIIDSGGHNVMIQADGGIDTTNAAQLVEAGVDVLVAGSSIFSSENPLLTIRNLKEFA